MKNKKFILFLLICLFTLVIVGCKNPDDNKDPDEPHIHEYVDGVCGCGEIDPNKPGNDKPVISTNDTSPLVSKVEGKIVYASPEIDYTSNNIGTEESPLNVLKAVTILTAGDTLILKNGTYILRDVIRIPETQNGNFASYIKVIAETPNEVVLDFSNMPFGSNNRGVQIDGDYWYFYGVNITGAGDNGMYIGGNFNIIELCQFYNNRDTGLQLGRSNGSYSQIKDWPSNNLIKNCTSYNNYDDETYGENADGFAAKLTTGEGNVFDGCIAYRNCDDGWDMYAKSDSGNVGSTIIKNCIAFENGMTLTPHHSDWQDETSPLVYTTRDGDGIGFKLGGSQMEGSVIIENCMAYNNKLEGFADNSNPGVISMRNCTAYNNSVQVKSDGSIGASDGLSRNFDIARKNMNGTNSDSYNNYYGLLSYSTNETDKSVVYSLGDTFKGSVGYSIFSKYSPVTKQSKYYAFYDFVDGNSYESDKSGVEYTKELTDAIFAAVKHSFITNDNEDLHTILRNPDGSINIGNMLDVVDPDLLTFCEGKQIGADLNKTSWEEYDHYVFSTPELGKATENYTRVLGAYDVLEVMCNLDAVFQDLKLLTVCNECDIYWESSNPEVIEVSTEEEKSFSGLTNVWGKVRRNRDKNEEVTLTATIAYNGAVLEKEFKVKVMQDKPEIGIVTGHDEKYILDQYDEWQFPSVDVTNKSSYSGLLLKENVDYEIVKSFKYATDKNSSFHEVSDVYTSHPGVYQVTYTIKSLINPEDVVESSYYVYVSSDTAEIDINSGSEIGINVVQEGVRVTAELSSTSGYMYAYVSNDTFITQSKVVSNGTKYEVNDEYIDLLIENENTDGYFLYIVFTNKANTYTSPVYNAEVLIKKITTCQEFYNMLSTGTSATTIYQLQNDLDFSNFTWREIDTTSTFGGLFDGNHHTISNITINGKSAKNVNIFYKVSGGTIVNTKFHNISLTGDGDGVTTKIGIIGQLSNGTIDNVEMKNISAYGYQGVGALVGQAVGGVNYISRVSLVNDENQSLFATGKYCGGIIGNVQKDSSEEKIEVYIENCYVNAVVGGDTDTGGYSGGIVGRYKNEYEVCVLSIQKCIVYGQVRTGKNYAGGITGGCDNGAGKTTISNCNVNITLWYVNTLIDGINAFSVKNGSPIMGRQTLGSGEFKYYNNYAPFADYNAGISDGEDYYDKLSRTYFWETSLKLDLEKTWTVDLTTGTAKLNYDEN